MGDGEEGRKEKYQDLRKGVPITKVSGCDL
jgi:hypothetical protein